MVEVFLDGYKYRYYKGEDGGHWIGVEGYNGSLGRYKNCSVPTMLWRPLREKALADGQSAEDFFDQKEETKVVKKKSSKSNKKKSKNSISIF